VIEATKNAYVILQNRHGAAVAGRLLGMSPDKRYVLAAHGGPVFCDPKLWKPAHWHNQPPEADDSPAWIATRKQIARAMSIERKRRSEPV
jgi:hypothetical protein